MAKNHHKKNNNHAAAQAAQAATATATDQTAEVAPEAIAAPAQQQQEPPATPEKTKSESAQASASGSAPASPSSTITSTVESLAHTVAATASPYLSPLVSRAKSNLPTELIERLEQASEAASTYSHSLLEQADEVADKLSGWRKTPDVVLKKAGEGQEYVKAKVAEGEEYVKSKVAEGEEFVKSKVASYGLPTSFAELKTLGTAQFEQLKAAATKLRASLAEVKLPLPEERVEQVRSAANKVLEALPKMPAFEWPQVDLSKLNSGEVVKFAQSLLSKITPYIEPYQARVRQILQDYKIEQRTAELKSKAVELYKGYGVDKVAPRFVSAFVVGETAAAAQ